MKTSSRLGFLAATAFLALSAGLALPAQAQNTAEVEYDNDNAPAPIITVINTIIVPPPATPTIVDLQSIFGANSGASTTDGTFVLEDAIAGNGSTFDASGNILTARTRGNNADNSVGLTSTDGSMILVGQQIVPDVTDVTALSSTLNDSVLGWILYGSATNVTGTVNNNTAQSYTTFNSNFATIDVEVPDDLVEVATGTYVATWDLGAADTATYFLTDLDQTANFNVASTQVNSGFANGNALDLATTSIDDTAILLVYNYDPAATAASGSFSVNQNTVNGITQGNAADNSIFLFDGGASVLGGSAVVSSTQLSSDSTEPTGAFPGISASNQDTAIGAVFGADADQTTFPPLAFSFGLPDIIAAENLNASVSGNTVASSATINSTRNAIGLEGSLDVDADTTGALVGLGLGSDPGTSDTEVEAQIAAINNQTAASGTVITGTVDEQLTGGSAPQAAAALTEDALIGIGVEDVDGASVLAIGDNTISASATGQLGNNSIQNNGTITDVNGDVTNLGAGTANLTGSFATVNRQLLVHPEIEALVVDSTILALVGSDESAAEAFGGLTDSALIVGDDPNTVEDEGNLFLASATGNGASSTVNLDGLTIIAPGTGEVFTENNEDVAVFTLADSNAGINLANWQFQNLAGNDDVGSVSATLDSVDINVFVNYAGGVVGSTQDAIEISNANINVDGNGGTASASLNSYVGRANIDASLGFEGTIAELSYQYANGAGDSQYAIDSEVVRANISVDLGVNGAAEDINASVSGNSYLALSNGNDSLQSLAVTAGTTIDVDADTVDGENAIIAQNISNPDSVTRVTDLEAAAAFIAVSDQTLRVTTVEARVDDVELELFLAAPADGTNTLDGGALALSTNELVAQVLGNNATNTVSVSAGTSINALAESGAIAGVVSSQSSVFQQDETISGESLFEAEVFNTSIHADVMTAGAVESVANVALNVDGNTVKALTYANSVSNTVSATSLDINAAFTTGVSLESFSTVANDLDLVVDEAALYVLNRQRNEGNDNEAQLGPSVTSLVSGSTVTATISGGTVGLDAVDVSLSSNAVQGVAAGNVAGNTINLNAGTTLGTADAAAGILNRQGNSGNIEADVDGGNAITATVVGATDATHSDLTLNVDRNEISGAATGNIATNRITAGGNTLNGTIDAGVTGGVYIGPEAGDPGGQTATVLTDVGSLSSNPDAFVNGNLAILNTQRNYGIPGTDGPDTPNLINSEVEGSTIGLTVPGEVTTQLSALSLSSNRVLSQAGANQATNEIVLTAASGLPGFASVLNNQGVELTQVSSAAADTTVALNVDNNFDGGTTAVNGNSVVASASLNSATNTLTSQSNLGALPSLTIVNYQTSTDSSVSSTNSGTSITHSAGLVGTGVYSNSSASVSGNQIGSSATINNATNTIGSPGQTFTRTSSF